MSDPTQDYNERGKAGYVLPTYLIRSQVAAKDTSGSLGNAGQPET
jgi:hypothetical protein